VRLLAGEKLDEVTPQLHRQVAEYVMEHPPYEMTWMKDFQHKVQLSALTTRAVTCTKREGAWPCHSAHQSGFLLHESPTVACRAPS
jgi:hypothetical protein